MAAGVSAVDQVIDELLLHIKKNQLGPGSKMPTEKEVCEMMGVGRSSVREAYKVMQTRGIVHSVQGKGVFINDTVHLNNLSANPFGDQEMRMGDYMDVRTAIEITAVRLAIQRATETQIQSLEVIHQDFLKGIEQSNVWKMANKDEEFHSQIAAITGNPLLIRVQDTVSEYFKSFRVRSFGISKNVSHAVSPHAMIIQAFRDRNPELGVLVMTQHLDQSYTDMRACLAEPE